jgi:hypothetical protein
MQFSHVSGCLDKSVNYTLGIFSGELLSSDEIVIFFGVADIFRLIEKLSILK